ncbi:MAG: hypothetical protein HOM21_11810, partial [Halobacteriovoraceae bacterium]|nr:hypothetical protein [Halobacteriovoraceae bacterium]
MKLLIIFILTLINLGCSHQMKEKAQIRLAHYNIKELDSRKIKFPGDQLKAVKSNLNKLDYNILSINEIQFDLPGVPNGDATTLGENLTKLGHYLDPEKKSWQQSFNPANTGAEAKRTKKGQFLQTFKDKGAMKYADPNNFGLFPGQYSTGALFSFKKLSETVISNLSWKKFNPSISLEKFRSASGRPFPSDLQLFDKNFSDVLLEIEGRKVHLILLHTVPSFDFGNERSPNYARNRDQLRFLEWYLTGKSDIEIVLPGIAPLGSDEQFIAVGDWNADYRDQSSLGGAVIRRLKTKLPFWMEAPGHTNQSGGANGEQLKLTLDYIAYSRGLELVEGSIAYPDP